MPKRSNSSPRSHPDWRPTLFLDSTSDSSDLAQVLVAGGWRVELHREHFSSRRDIADHEWIPLAVELGCGAIISSDKRMQGWRAESGLVRPAIEKCSAKVFFVRSAGRTLTEQAHAIGLARNDIVRACRQNHGTYLFARIHTTGNRVGTVDVLAVGETSKAKRKYGADFGEQVS